MTQTSIGFAGTVDDKQWARLGRLLGEAPCLERIGDLPVAPVAGQRQITIGLNPADQTAARSSIYADGVLTDIDAAETITLPTPTDGQWFLVVNKRDWASRTTAFEIRPGALTSPSDQGAVPAYPDTLLRDPGTEADVPVMWVWATASSTVLTIVPLLAVSRSLYPRRGSSAERDAYFASMMPINGGTAGPAKFAELAGEWVNVPGGWTERYYGPRAARSGSIIDVARPAGWYPVSGQLPSFTFKHPNDYLLPLSPDTDVVIDGFTAPGRNFWGDGGQGEPNLGLAYLGNGRWAIPLPGRWRLTVYARFVTNTGGSLRTFGARADSLSGYDAGNIAVDSRGTTPVPRFAISGEWVVPEGGDVLSLFARHDSDKNLGFTVYRCTVEYIGPN